MEKNYANFDKSIAIITSNRPDYLEAITTGIAANLPMYGNNPYNWPLLVVDNSGPECAAQNVALLQRLKQTTRMPLFYFGASEFEQMVAREGDDFRDMFSGHGCPDLRNLAMIATTDKTLVLLDDDMLPTQSVLRETASNEYPSLISSGRFLSLSDFAEQSYREPFDLVDATTSELGKRVRDVDTISERIGKAVGSRDQVIDYLMSGMAVNRDAADSNNYCYCHIESGDVNPDAVIKWQGLAAVTEKADCHATASVLGLSMATDASVIEYGNLFVNYAVHARPVRIAVANDWKESSMAAFGILNDSPLPSYPLPRNEDVAYRHMISAQNPIALSGVAVDHNRSLTGRPKLSVIYFNEIMGAKICRNLREAVNGRVGHWNLSKVEPLQKDQRAHLRKSMKSTCATLDTVRKNGNREMAIYADQLIQEIADLFAYKKAEAFWLESEFGEKVNSVSQSYFDRTMATSQQIFDRWDQLVDNVRKQGMPVTRI